MVGLNLKDIRKKFTRDSFSRKDVFHGKPYKLVKSRLKSEDEALAFVDELLKAGVYSKRFPPECREVRVTKKRGRIFQVFVPENINVKMEA